MRKIKQFCLIVILSVFSLSFNTQVARAETKVFSKLTSLDTYNRPDLNPKYDIERVETGLWDSDLDSLHFWILFKQPLTSQMFNDNQGSWAGILIDINNDGNDDIVINTLARGYTGNYSQTASAVYRNGSRSCSAVSWMDLDNNSRWLGFKVSQKCLGLSNSFKVQGYADYISSDSASFDYAPDGYELVDLDDFYKPKPKITLSIPDASPEVGKALSNYSNAPENLVSLSSGLRDSVVTIECINGSQGSTGTAWSAKSNIPISNYKTYLITNYHVISDCIYIGNVDVILNNGTKITGVLAAWDPDNDIAGIYLNEYVPPLIWQGENPYQGSWVGVLGSPKGVPGILTSGIISSASLDEKYITFTAPINPGNSGGPVFDSTGRVIAIATAKVRDSEGFAIGNGVPLICKVVIRCGINLQGWGSKSTTNNQNSNSQNNNSIVTNKLKQKIISNYPRSFDLIDGNKLYISQEDGIYDNTEIYIYSNSGLRLNFSTYSPNICEIDGNSTLVFLEPGTCNINISQNGDLKYDAVSELISINVKGKKSQEIVVGELIDVSVSRKKIDILVYSTSDLPVKVVSLNKTICLPLKSNNGWQIQLKKSGTCRLFFSQKGDSNNYPAESIEQSFIVKAAIKTTITCIKGNSTASITSINPVCPSGYQKK